MDSSTVCNSLARLDSITKFPAVEEVGDKLDDTGDIGRTTDENDFVDLRLTYLGVTEDPFDGLAGRTEEILAEILETRTGKGSVEIITLGWRQKRGCA